MKRLCLGLSLLAALALAGCHPDPCSRVSPCPNDAPSSDAQRAQCRATLQANQNSACYSEMLDYSNCVDDNIVCGGNGKTDFGLTATQSENNCRNQKANSVACCIKNPDATACR